MKQEKIGPSYFKRNMGLLIFILSFTKYDVVNAVVERNCENKSF